MAGLSHTYKNRQFAGTIVQEGPGRNRLKLNAPVYYQHMINQFKPGDYVNITITNKRPKRTVSQNNYYWGAVLPAIAEETGETDLDALHELFKSKFLVKESAEVFGETIIKAKSTTDLSVLEFGEFIEKIAGLTGIKLPDAQNYLSLPPKQKK